MLNLDGYVTFDILRNIRRYTDTRFRDSNVLKAAEALTLYEQSYLPDETIKELCEKTYGMPLTEPLITYIPKDVVRKFDNSGLVPVQYQPMKGKIIAVYLPDIEYSVIEIPNFTLEIMPTTVPYYFIQYGKHFGQHPYLLDIPAKDIFDSIVQEATTKGAADITISTTGQSAMVYYNIRKKKVYSHRVFKASDMRTLITILFAKSPFQFDTRAPQATGVILNEDYTGRVECTAKYGGYMITIRVLPRKAFSSELEDLNLTQSTIKFLREKFLDGETGLHLIVGATMSGKNTTMLACLREIALPDNLKIISVEMPVEQELFGVEQISCESAEEYELNCDALIRENPDIVYITETNDSVGKYVIKTANTGKSVLTTLHANTVSGTLTRLQDVTGMSIDRLLFNIHSIVYQELRRDDEKDIVYPWNRYVRFTKELKMELYGKSLGEMAKIIDSYEEGDE